ncbi:MAG: double-strand break repair protein AddB [Alphaproteobacteria bacterium]
MAELSLEPARIFTIDSDRPFLDVLASRLIERHGGDPLGLARVRVLLPTRRACRALRDAFLRQSGARALILPRLAPLGALDEDDDAFADAAFGDVLDCPAAIAPAHRVLLLARLILHRGGAGMPADQAVHLAAALARLIDQVQTEQRPWSELGALVPDELAAHWAETLHFLQIVTDSWPAVLAERNRIDPAEGRNRLLLDQARRWREQPPADPVFVAGSTGSVPAAAELIAAVAACRQGAVVLPGLDLNLAADPLAWQAVDQTHPQYGMKQLLARLSVAPDEVEPWPRTLADGPGRADRRRLIGLAMRPADLLVLADEAVGDPLTEASAESALQDVVRVDCASPQEEATAIALALREALEIPGRTALMVTPDRDLAQRVAAMLTRWGLQIDDSAGRPLANTPAGAFLRLLLAAAGSGLAPADLLALAKHPLAAAGQAPSRFRKATRQGELSLLRGPSPEPGFPGLRKQAADLRSEARRAHALAWIASLETAIGGLVARAEDTRPQPFADLLAALVAAAESLATTDAAAGGDLLWVREDGEAARGLIDELFEASDDAEPMSFTGFAAALDAFMATVPVRPAYGAHPRIAILGPLEARLQAADLVVLAGLNEGAWPPEPPIDPWMSRPMRRDFGLPQPERRIGLSAHDFAQAFAAPCVLMTRATRVAGAPTSPARWLRRLDAVLDQVGGQPGRLRPSRGPYRNWAAALDRPRGVRPTGRPNPKPPVSARPRRLWVTHVETWMRNPYAVYARHVLGLRRLKDIAEDVTAAEFGSRIHEALDAFVRTHGPVPGPDAREALLAIGEAIFADLARRPDLADVVSFWRARFIRIVGWFIEHMGRTGSKLAAVHTEIEGHCGFDGPAGPFMLSAKADRLDIGHDGAVTIIDYKTGAPPSGREVVAGFAPQLPLEGAILRAGGFPGIPATVPGIALEFWQLKGRDPAARICPAGNGEAPFEALIDDAVRGLCRLIAAFDDPATGYLSRPSPAIAPKYDDYEHLARVAEWSTVDSEEAE